MNQRATVRARSIDALTGAGQLRVMSCDPTERVCPGLHMARTRKDVADQLAVLIAKTKAGLPLAVESWTLERFAEHWLKQVVWPRLRPSTLSSYRETLRLHVLPTLGP